MQNIIPPPQFGQLKFNFNTFFVLSFVLLFGASSPSSAQIGNQCTPVEGDLILNNEQISIRFPNGLYEVGRKIFVYGTVVFDRPVQLIGCTVKMDASNIQIEDKGWLKTFGKTNFSGCNSLWGTIEVRENCYVDLYDSSFKDAFAALTFKENHLTSAVSIIRCTFTNNRTCLAVEGGTNAKPLVFKPSAFRSNTFQGGTLLDNGYSFSGITVSNCSEGEFLGRVGEENNFKEMEFGMFITSNSNVRVAYGKFWKMLDKGNGGGYGILAFFRNWLNVAYCHFELDEKDGIRSTLNNELTVGNCEFKNEKNYGVYSQANPNIAKIIIKTNTFNLDDQGRGAIYHERSASAIYLSNIIQDNRVFIRENYTNNSVRFIDIQSPYGGTGLMSVGLNHIRCYNPTFPFSSWGIYVTGNSDNIQVHQNTFYYNRGGIPNRFTTNIALAVENLNGTSHGVYYNSVKSSITGGPNYTWHHVYCGIHVVNSPGIAICNNDTDSTHRGFHFGGELAFCSWVANTMGAHHYGIQCQTGGAAAITNLGNQNWHKNVWSTNPNHYLRRGADYADSSAAPFVCRIDGSTLGHMPPSVNPPSNWFIDDPEGMSSADCGNSEPPIVELSTDELSVINGTFTPVSASHLWDKERKLLLKLRQYPELRPSGSIAHTWYSNKHNTTAFQFAEIEYGLRKAFEYPTTLYEEWAAVEAQRQQILREVASLDSLLAINGPSDSLLLAQSRHKSGLLDSLQQRLLSLDDEQDSLSNIALLNAQYLLSTLVLNDAVYETNRRNALLAQVKLLMRDTLNTNEKNLMHQIAAQCPTVGGEAVALAPQNLPFSEAVAYFMEDYHAGCVEERSRQLAPNNAIPVALYPNPATTVISIVKGGGALADWAILDMTGRQLKQGAQSGERLEIPVSDLSNGVYLLFLLDATNGTPILTKFTILR